MDHSNNYQLTDERIITVYDTVRIDDYFTVGQMDEFRQWPSGLWKFGQSLDGRDDFLDLMPGI